MSICICILKFWNSTYLYLYLNTLCKILKYFLQILQILYLEENLYDLICKIYLVGRWSLWPIDTLIYQMIIYFFNFFEWVVLLYNGNCPRKKMFMNFVNLEAFSNVFLHFLSWQEFYIWDCLNCKSFLVNYGKECNSWNFSTMDDSRYTICVV